MAKIKYKRKERGNSKHAFLTEDGLKHPFLRIVQTETYSRNLAQMKYPVFVTWDYIVHILVIMNFYICKTKIPLTCLL